jgi:hypothetical protein
MCPHTTDESIQVQVIECDKQVRGLLMQVELNLEPGVPT